MQFIQGADRPLDCHWQADPGVLERLGMPVPSKKAEAVAKASIVACAVIERLGAGRRVSYSRNRNFYGDGRYGSMSLSHRLVTGTVDAMEQMGLAWHAKQAPGAHLKPVPMQSAFWATDRMMSLVGDVPLHHRGPTSHVKMRDEYDELWDLSPRTEREHRAVAEVDSLNRDLRRIRVDVDPAADPANWQRDRYHLRARRVRPDGSETWAVVTPHDPEVVRIFGRGRLDMHGRLYGWWQNLPKERRRELRINGEVIIEPDFSSLHPTLLYYSEGLTLSHDPYVADLKRWTRRDGKFALNVAINAPTRQAAVQALLAKRAELDVHGEPVWKHGPASTRTLIERLAKVNQPIAHHLGSDAGVRLMGIDSRICLDVLKRCRKDGVAVLPVHDSFMAGASNEGIVRGHMASVLDEVRVTISSKVSTTSSRTVLQMPRRGAAEPPSSLPAEPVEVPLAEPEARLPAEPRTSLPAEPRAASALLGSENPQPRRAASSGRPSTLVVFSEPVPPPVLDPSPCPSLDPGDPSLVTLDLSTSEPVVTLDLSSLPPPGIWTLYLADGVHRGHSMFLRRTAIAALEAGLDPFTPRPMGRVAAGLPPRAVSFEEGVVAAMRGAYTRVTPPSRGNAAPQHATPVRRELGGGSSFSGRA